MTQEKNNTASDWFVNWFDSPHYHILYHKRNEEEANLFIKNLCKAIELPADAKILDLACGKGRHSLTLNKLGFNVVGADLSPNSIQFAKQFENNSLKFKIHDMREPFERDEFDAIFNLFTSIGYFENELDNFRVFKNAYTSLKNKGTFVVDFFNANWVINNLKPFETKIIEGVEFFVKKEIANNRVIKTINFSFEGKNYHFEEKVFLYKEQDFVNFAENTGFRLQNVFGDYNLNPFDITKSERLILIFKK